MKFRQLDIGRRRSYSLALGVPLGFLAYICGIALFEQRLGKVLVLGGFVFLICGMPSFRQFLKDAPIRKGTMNVVLLGMVLLFFVAGPVYIVAKAVRGVAQPGDYRVASNGLLLICLSLPSVARRVEPKDFPLRRLPSRIRRATVFRTVANGAGIGAVAAFLNARFIVAHPAPLISTVLTLVIATAVVTHKTYARARKLCTQTHVDIQKLLRDMDDLDDTKGRDRAAKRPPRHWRPRLRTSQEADGKQADKRMTARQSWYALKLDLCTTIDSGYRLFGMPLLTDSVIADLEKKVMVGIDAADPDASEPARVDLHAILTACAARIDVLA